MLTLVTMLLALGLAAALLHLSFGRRLGCWLLRRWKRWARREDLAVGTIGLVCLLAISSIGLIQGVAPPSIHDEFSYLLAADTFVHGRLTNPPLPDPVWRSFDTMHVLQRPTYQSKYPPGQGMALALGRLLGGTPSYGVWLSTAAAIAAVTWMLYGFLPPRWALLGGVLALLHPLTLRWSQSYWGGSVAVLGGALVLGALPRILGRAAGPRQLIGLSLTMGAGLAILSNSRPFEGLVVSLPVAGMLFWGLWRSPLPAARKWAQVILPISAVMLLDLGFIGYYNYRITGNVLRMPYLEYERQYEMAPPFIWLPARPSPGYSSVDLADWFQNYQLPIHTRQQSLFGLLREIVQVKTPVLEIGFLDPPLLALGLLAIPWLVGRRRRLMACALFTLALLFAALMSELLVLPHYAAPGFALFLLLVVAGLRLLRRWRWGRYPLGQLLFAAALLGSLLSWSAWPLFRSPTLAEGAGLRRQEMEVRFDVQSGNNLIFVIKRPGADIHFDWIYNTADLSSSRIVWARYLDAEQNRRVIAYFPNRLVWTMTIDANGFRLDPYLP